MEDKTIHSSEEYWSEIEKQIGKLVETSSSGSTIGESLKSLMKKVHPKSELVEERYFISYSAYPTDGTGFDTFNDIIIVDEPITMDIIETIQEDLVKRLNDFNKKDTYYVAQIITINKI